MSLTDGDLLVVRLPEDTNPDHAREILGQILNSIRTVDHIQIHVVAALGAFEIEHLDEDQMRHYGWVRADGAH